MELCRVKLDRGFLGKTVQKNIILYINKQLFLKASFSRHNGDLGNQIKHILNHCDKSAAKVILMSANRIYGKKYMDAFLTYNPLKILTRKITYLYKKIKNGEL